MAALSTIQRSIGAGMLVAILLLSIYAARLEYLRAGYKADLAACQSARRVDSANAERDAAKAEAGFARQQADATTAQAGRDAVRAPIIIRSTDTVREYAQTDAGRAVCRGSDRVQSVDQLDRDIATAARPAGSGAHPVQSNSAASPVGR